MKSFTTGLNVLPFNVMIATQRCGTRKSIGSALRDQALALNRSIEAEKYREKATGCEQVIA